MLKAVIFDLDGVIVDTVPIHFKAWKKMFAEYGIDFTFDEYKAKVDGIPRTDGARAILKDLDDKELEKAATRKQKFYLEYLKADKIPAYDTTIALIKDLVKRRVKAAVISSSKNCKFIIDKIKLTKLLDAIVTGNDITKGKPDPQIFLLAAEKMKVNPKDCIVFEDAVLGVKAAKNAGMFSVGVDRYKDKSRLAEADIVISDAAELTADKLISFLWKGKD